MDVKTENIVLSKIITHSEDLLHLNCRIDRREIDINILRNTNVESERILKERIDVLEKKLNFVMGILNKEAEEKMENGE